MHLPAACACGALPCLLSLTLLPEGVPARLLFPHELVIVGTAAVLEASRLRAASRLAAAVLLAACLQHVRLKQPVGTLPLPQHPLHPQLSLIRPAFVPCAAGAVAGAQPGGVAAEAMQHLQLPGWVQALPLLLLVLAQPWQAQGQLPLVLLPLIDGGAQACSWPAEHHEVNMHDLLDAGAALLMPVQPEPWCCELERDAQKVHRPPCCPCLGAV